jgi:hypothetical protein
MLPSSPASYLARRLISDNTGESSEAVAEAIEVACRAVREELAGPLGRGGVSALMGRALSLAKKVHPLLDSVTVDDGAPSCFAGLSNALAVGPVERAREAGESILGNFFELLVVLLGEELGMQPLHKLWPQLSAGTKEITG